MQDGLVEQAGAPLELYERPANLFVAGFIGSPAMNFIKGRIDNSAFVSTGGLSLPVTEELAGKAAGRDLVYGIRPEHIHVAGEGIRGTVELVEPTGSELFAQLVCSDESISCLFRERGLILKPGQEIAVRIDPADAHLFDAASGKRIR
jgi:multiple sugar transport system ATP-binding protein